MTRQTLSTFIWSIADLLRGDYKKSDNGKVILPFTILRRIDCVLEESKEEVLYAFSNRKKTLLEIESLLKEKSGQNFYNISPFNMKKLLENRENIKENLLAYIQGFSFSVRDIFERFNFSTQIEKLSKCGLLSQVIEKFAQIDLHPNKISNSQMGQVFEELIRKFAESSKETAGEHFTPRDAIRLMVNLLFIEDEEALQEEGNLFTIYDPTAGTGGMLLIASEYLKERRSRAQLAMFGQELNDESYAICRADMLIKGQNIDNIVAGNTLSADGHPNKTFDYMLSNPPFGVEWKKVEKEVRQEHQTQGYKGRFGPGLPRVSDGSLLFLLHLISKMRPAKEGGSRIGIVLNGSPLFTGQAGSGESEIRRYILENDLLEAIIALPTDMFYNTGISTYIWILSNRKKEMRQGKVQLIDASQFWQKMRKSLGSKRKEMTHEHIQEITELYLDFSEVHRNGAAISQIFSNETFGYRTITIERPLRGEKDEIIFIKNKPKPDINLRDTENIPLGEDIYNYFTNHVLPYAPDAWIDHKKTKIGYEIPFNRLFHIVKENPSLEAINKELKIVMHKIYNLFEELSL